MSSPSPLTGKPQITVEDVLPLLRERFTAPIEDLSVFPGGQISQVFSFSVNGAGYILRIAPEMGANLGKEVFIQRLLALSPASSLVPIPPILHVGRLGPLHYAISRRMPGTPYTELSPSEYVAAMPALLETLDAIHAADVRATTGYGVLGEDGSGPFAT